MSTTFNNRVYGAAIIKSINSNYNADFSGQPRKLPNGTVYATDKALKYSIRNYWKNILKENVFFFKSYDDMMKPRTLDERYLELFKDFKRDITSDKYCLFQFDGDNIKGLIPNQPKSKNVKDVYKGVDEEDELNSIKEFLTILSTKKIQISTLNNVNKDNLEEDTNIFYIDNNGKYVKVLEDEFIVKKGVDMLLENMGGGVNRTLTLKDLLSCLDVRLFGATYAGQTNISVHGTCQITHGLNKFTENVIYSEQIMSPFKNSNSASADSTMTTLGTQSRLQEGHYVHHFSVNPQNIEEDVKRTNSESLTPEDIDKLKEGLRRGATYYDSAAKAGTENELLLWIQLKPGSKLVLPSFVSLIDVNENKEIDLSKVSALLSKEHIKTEIEKIEIYYNKANTEVLAAPAGAEFSEL
ncbi:type I CRISPR-associated protein Cas7 [Parabacteroides sp. Marseille-P3160]|uniref:type I CRISPR-associated protein Cas7 n=1 Tax=Parabacteroides sp. Marseille-P3160 TaxID=1917887 RepID=UPI0009BAADD7|nr:type I CRISPR-associated protein Cas7 [Parabacteroides sp. Marseille-P3160]